MTEVTKSKCPLNYTYGYIVSFIYIVGITVYVNFLIVDFVESCRKNKRIHTTKEYVWMFILLLILVIGYYFGYYEIICSVDSALEKVKSID